VVLILILFGKLIKETKIVKEAVIEDNREGIAFRDILEQAMIGICKEMDISVPLWLKKNSTELGSFRKTFFTAEQFVEDIKFDRFEINIKM